MKIVAGVAGGKTTGSKVMVVGTPSLLAAAIAALRLPVPESAVLVTTIAHDDAAPKVRKLKTSARWKKYCAGRARLVRFSFVSRLRWVFTLYSPPCILRIGFTF